MEIGRKSLLPEEGSRDLRVLKEKYPTADVEQIKKWAQEYGFSNAKSFVTRVKSKFGWPRISSPKKPKRNESVAANAPIVVNLPPVKFHNIGINFGADNGGDEETVVVIASDGHAGKITKSFNRSVYRDRMGKMYESTMKIVELHRHMYPIKKITVINCGDNIQGESPWQGSKIGEVEMGARDQVKQIAVPAWNDFLGSLKNNFESVTMHGVPGNHGHDKLAPETSSYDLLFYDILEAGIGQYKGINIYIYDDFCAIVDIKKFKFFIFHGDGIPCQQGVPFFALDKKLKSWYMQYGGFNYACGGHFHKRHFDEISNKLEYFMCSTLVSDDTWALKKLGISSSPSQWIMGVHPKHGVTWRYPLGVDDKFLPSKI